MKNSYNKNTRENYLNFRPVDVEVGDRGLLGIVLDDDDFLGKL